MFKGSKEDFVLEDTVCPTAVCVFLKCVHVSVPPPSQKFLTLETPPKPTLRFPFCPNFSPLSTTSKKAFFSD